IVERCQGRMVAGSGVATFDGPARAIRCARALVSEVGSSDTRPGVAVHSGECQLDDGAVRGVAVDIVREMAADAAPRAVLLSQTVRDLIAGSTITLRFHARRSFTGVAGEWEMFEVAASDSPTAPPA